MKTGRAGSNRRSASHSRDSNCFCPGCGLPGTEPEHRAAVVGQQLPGRAPARPASPALAASGSCPSRWGRTPRGTESAAAVHPARRSPRAGIPCSRLRAGAPESRSGPAPAPASRCACRRASNRPAASSPSACRAPRVRCARAMLRATSAAPRFCATKGETCLYSVPTMRRSSSFRLGQFTAPGRRSSAYSLFGARVDHRVELGQPGAGASCGDDVSRPAWAGLRPQSRRAIRSRSAICLRFCCSAGPSIRKVSSTRSPSVVILASCRLMWWLRQHAGDGVEQARAVAGRHAEQPALRPFVGPQRDARRDREAT